MVRKNKIGIDYFSHDVEMMSDSKIRFIKAKHGLLGYAVFLRILEEIYKEKGYYLKNGEKFNILFADENKIQHDVCINVINDCINEELFDINVYKTHGILTSRRIQFNYLEAVERRKSVDLISEYLVPDVKKHIKNSEKMVNVNIFSLNDNINPLNANKSTQIENENENEKEKEKEKENIKSLPEKKQQKNGNDLKNLNQNEKTLIKEIHQILKDKTSDNAYIEQIKKHGCDQVRGRLREFVRSENFDAAENKGAYFYSILKNIGLKNIGEKQ